MAYLTVAFAAPAAGVFPYLLLAGWPNVLPSLVLWCLLVLGNVGVGAMLVVLTYSVAFFGALTPDRVVKILDFGLAKPMLRGDLDDQLTGKGQLVGTSRAMAPEYVSGEEVDHRSDLFSLGVLLYEAATGHSPFKSHNTLATLKQVMLYRQTPAHQLDSRVPPDLSDSTSWWRSPSK